MSIKNTKQKGNRNERRSMEYLEQRGFRCCRSAASLGVWDIIGIGTSSIVLVQVKSNRWPLTAEMNTLREFQAPYNCQRVVHRWDDYDSEPKIRVVE